MIGKAPEISRRFEADDVALSSQGLARLIDQNASTRVNRSWVDVSASWSQKHPESSREFLSMRLQQETNAPASCMHHQVMLLSDGRARLSLQGSALFASEDETALNAQLSLRDSTQPSLQGQL
jgi:hypothetical protein